MSIDTETGADHSAALKMTDEHRALVQKWLDEGASLVTVLYVLGTALTMTLAQAGALRAKIERLRSDILQWINSTTDMEIERGMNRAQRRAARKKTKH